MGGGKGERGVSEKVTALSKEKNAIIIHYLVNNSKKRSKKGAQLK